MLRQVDAPEGSVVNDSLFVGLGGVAYAAFVRTLKKIFVRMGYQGHFDMMMRTDAVAELAAITAI